MTESSRFFGSAEADPREYNQAEFAAALYALTDDGIAFGSAGGLLVQPTSPPGMAVNVIAGSAWIQGYYYVNDATLPLVITAADPSNSRKDRIVLRLDAMTERKITAMVREGTPSANPVAPALIRQQGVYELSLAVVTVPPGATVIDSANIDTTDRADPTVCGYAGPHRVGQSNLAITAALSCNANRIVDVADPTSAQDAATKAYVDATTVATAAVPAGCMMAWGGNTGNVPVGWLLCDGAEYLRADYAALFAAIGVAYGTPSSVNHFKVPDLRAATVCGYVSNITEFATIGSRHPTTGALHTTTSSGAPNIPPYVVTGGYIIKT